MKTYLHVGGLVAAGFDPSGAYLLTITHSGRGVFATQTWSRVARNTELAYQNVALVSVSAKLKVRLSRSPRWTSIRPKCGLSVLMAGSAWRARVVVSP